MDYEPRPEETSLAARVEALLAAHPDLTAGAARAWLARLGACGYLAAGEDQAVARLLAGKALAARAPWLLFAAELQRLVAELIAAHGAMAQREALLPGLRDGTRVAALAFSEPDRGLAAEPGCRAEPAGEDHLLSGDKGQVSLAAACDWLAVAATTPRGPAVLLVARDAPGVELGAPLASFGYAELDGRPVRLRQVRVPPGQVLGPLPAGELAAALRRAEDRQATAASLGLMARCLEAAREAAQAPRAGGKPAMSHQLVRFELAEVLTQLQTAELLALRAAAAEAAGAPDAARLALCAKLFASEAACRVSDQALGILGAAGYLEAHPVARAVAEARFACLAGHGPRAARLAIADEVLARLAPR